ncbi:MAG: hypothetical protein H0W89_07810 [Candidatus Levybacteria bacterium]|nr:hypothetical protein [Candidatus Levybacteria bacterium]
MPDIFTQPHDKKDTPADEKPQQPPVAQTPKEMQSVPPEQVTPPPVNAEENATPIVQQQPANEVAPEKKVQLPSTKASDVAARAKIPSSPVGFFGHYKQNPNGIHFANQEDDEQILLFLRKHFITNLPWLIITAFLMVLPLFVFLLFSLSNFTLFSIPPQLVIILLAFYFLIVLNYALLNFITWFYDVGIVTKKRLLDLDADNILKHHLAETEIEDVVDVSYAQQGFFQSFFNYGNVHIQTQAIKANFEYIASPNPATVSDIISDLKALKLNGEKKHA